MYILLAVLGLIIGSFLNVCIYRIPSQESIVFPSSHCPHCDNHIKWYDNIPVVSYLILLGSCRYCAKKISLRYPFVEILTAALFILMGYKFGLSFPLVPYCLFVASLIVVSFIDYDYKIIPNVITLPGMIVGLLLSIVPQMPVTFISSLIGLTSSWVLFKIIAIASLKILKKEGMGGGDVKLIAMIGAFVGWEKALLTIFCASLLGSVWGTGLILVFLALKKKRSEIIPFGPFLCIGALISLIYGDGIISWYCAPFRL
ncbi:MAG: prepilin peptidase [bacterium]